MGSPVRVAIIGSTGYGGVELIRLLLSHPKVKITSVISTSQANIPISEQYPHLLEIMVQQLDQLEIEQIAKVADVVFLATPAGVSAQLSPLLLNQKLKVIDLSGDFRIRQPEIYEQYYKHQAPPQEYLSQATYGLVEVFSREIQNAGFISNPGCYPTASLLGLAPLVQERWIDLNTIIIDAKSGVSGAGRGINLGVHFAEVNENLSVYKLNKHQHIPEIEQTLTQIAGKPVVVTFSTHLVPMTRGIMSTIYASLNESTSDESIVELYKKYYAHHRFVRIREKGKWPATKEVMGSNYCDIGFSVDERTNRVTIVSVIDNLVKGAAGQAIQNLNVMLGWSEGLGLEQSTPLYP